MSCGTKRKPSTLAVFYDIVGIQSRKFVFISKKNDWRIKVMQYMIILIWCGCDNIECYQHTAGKFWTALTITWFTKFTNNSVLCGWFMTIEVVRLLFIFDFFSFSGCFICLNKLHHCIPVSWLNMGWQQIMEL